MVVVFVMEAYLFVTEKARDRYSSTTPWQENLVLNPVKIVVNSFEELTVEVTFGVKTAKVLLRQHSKQPRPHLFGRKSL